MKNYKILWGCIQRNLGFLEVQGVMRAVAFAVLIALEDGISVSEGKTVHTYIEETDAKRMPPWG